MDFMWYWRKRTSIQGRIYHSSAFNSISCKIEISSSNHSSRYFNLNSKKIFKWVKWTKIRIELKSRATTIEIRIKFQFTKLTKTEIRIKRGDGYLTNSTNLTNTTIINHSTFEYSSQCQHDTRIWFEWNEYLTIAN